MRAALLLMMLSATVLWVWLLQHPPIFADALTLSEVWHGLREGAGLSPWLFSIAPSLFPDLGATALVSWWTPDLLLAQRLHGFLIGLGAGWGAARLIQQLWGLPKWQARAFAAAGLILGFVLTPVGGLGHLIAPSHHGWPCVVALFAWAWALEQADRPQPGRPSLGLGLFWGLTLAVDKFMLFGSCCPCSS
jgi:hypothetical protein